MIQPMVSTYYPRANARGSPLLAHGARHKMTILSTPGRFVRPACGSWREEMRRAIRDGGELCRAVGLSPQIADAAAAGQFPVFAPWPYISRIRRGDPDDPLLRQVLPLGDENLVAEGFSTDPVGDGPATRSPGLIHKYRGRALLVTTGACAIHCRYCFRREFPYGDTPHSLAHWQEALDEIAADASIREVIYSGGDPLTLVDEFLAELTGRLVTIDMTRSVLQDLLRANDRKVTIDEIMRQVSDYYNLRLSEILSARRARDIARIKDYRATYRRELVAEKLY